MLDDKAVRGGRLVAAATSPSQVILFASYTRGMADEPERVANDRYRALAATWPDDEAAPFRRLHRVVDRGCRDRNVSIPIGFVQRCA